MKPIRVIATRDERAPVDRGQGIPQPRIIFLQYREKYDCALFCLTIKQTRTLARRLLAACDKLEKELDQ